MNPLKKIIQLFEDHPGKILLVFFIVLIAANIAFFAVAFTQPVDLLPAAEGGPGK
jgi:hypothetical protein